MPNALGDFFLGVRDRFLSSARFQSFAAAFPLTRPIARRRAGALFDLVAGFVYSQVLTACLRLRLLEAMAERPQTLDALAEHTKLPLDALERLLTAAVSLRLVSMRSGGRYGLGRHGAPLLANPGAAAMIKHNELVYSDLADPVSLLKGEFERTGLSAYWSYAETDSPGALKTNEVSPYSALMSASQAAVAAEVLDCYPLRRHRHLLDVGGGDGAFIRAAAFRAPHMRFTLFDLPAVAELARTRLRGEEQSGRVSVVAGSFFDTPLPCGADVSTLVRVLLDHDDESALRILKAVREALPREGTLLIAEPLSEENPAGSRVDAYFGLYLLAMGRGRLRTYRRHRQLLTEAGFGDIRRLRTRQPLNTGLIGARVAA